MNEWGIQLRDRFRYYATRIADKVGSPGTFGLGLLVVLVWGATGPVFHYSDTWQLVINTGTSVITFLMVFLIQNSIIRSYFAWGINVFNLADSTSLSVLKCKHFDLSMRVSQGNRQPANT